MRLQVVHKDGRTEEIVLIGPIEVIPPAATLWKLRDAAGVEHFFTESGFYDGQGGLVVGME